MKARRAFSLIGMLVTLVCMLVLMTIGMSAMNKAVTGEGSSVKGTVHSMEDQLKFYGLYQSMVVFAGDNKERYLAPSQLTGRDRQGDQSENTTANLFSAMLMQKYVTDPNHLISANEYSGYVWPVEDYDYTLYDPAGGVYWDPGFEANLADLSNVSFAHMPLYGERYRKRWIANFGSDFPILGNRGPKDGIDDPTSWTYGRNGVWGGHVVYGDGNIQFINTFTPPIVVFERDGARHPDNIFAMEDGPAGRDAVLSFTREMTGEGPLLQYD